MLKSRRIAPAVLLLLVFGSVAFADDLPRLFQTVKQQFRMGAYKDALSTLDQLSVESEKPGAERFRPSLRPGLAFYRGACLAALGRDEEARVALEEFLTYEPNASLDPSIYPHKVVAALASARKTLHQEKDHEVPQAESGSLAAAYRAFTTQSVPPPPPLDETWADGPAKYLMTADERLAFSRLSDPVTRSEFVTEFWRRRDPHPETPENEFREEFERRVAFADARLTQDETRGSLTDRGMVFILLGAPTYIGRKPLRTGEDTADPSGMVLYTDQDLSNALRGVQTGSPQAAMIYTQMAGPNNRLPDPDGNYREVWHYRRELLPPSISYHQVDFDFISRKGYGKNVLQRDDKTLATLETARKSMRAGIVPQRAAK
jgi:GWxTD domain-containing protein